MSGSMGNPQNVTIRPFADADMAAIRRLSAAEGWLTPSQRPAAALAAWQRSYPALVAVADGEVVGFLRALSDRTVTTYICELLVAPAWRRQGIGGALIAACRHLVPATRLDLLSTADAESFYRVQGFRPLAGFRKSRP